VRLHYGSKSFILAKDTKKGLVKKGGLGALGVGEMWMSVSEKDKLDPDYELAPEEDGFRLIDLFKPAQPEGE